MVTNRPDPNTISVVHNPGPGAQVIYSQELVDLLIPGMRLDLPPRMALSSADTPRVLIADDQADVLDALRLLLHPAGILTDAAQSPSAVLGALRARDYDVLLMDLNYARDTTSGQEGLELLGQVRAIDPDLPILVMTGWATLDVALEALRHGVRDFVQKPWENDRVLASVRAQAEGRRAARRAAAQQVREQAEAREMQRALLPHHLPVFEGWEIAARCEPAECVGGDTFDMIRLDERRLGVSLGDVSGKGFPAALLASNLQAAVRAAAARDLGPAALCAEVNRSLCVSLTPWRFVTYFYGVLDTMTGHFRYCNAGHIPPLHVRPDGSLARLHSGGIVLGVAPESRYAEGAVNLRPGDRLVIVTDGLTEPESADGQEFGDAGVAAAVAAAAAAGRGHAAAALTALFDAVARHCSGPPQDDRTAVMIARN